LQRGGQQQQRNEQQLRRGRQREVWEKARAAVGVEMSPQERGTVRFKIKAANQEWQREAVEARRAQGMTAM